MAVGTAVLLVALVLAYVAGTRVGGDQPGAEVDAAAVADAYLEAGGLAAGDVRAARITYEQDPEALVRATVELDPNPADVDRVELVAAPEAPTGPVRTLVATLSSGDRVVVELDDDGYPNRVVAPDAGLLITPPATAGDGSRSVSVTALLPDGTEAEDEVPLPTIEGIGPPVDEASAPARNPAPALAPSAGEAPAMATPAGFPAVPAQEPGAEGTEPWPGQVDSYVEVPYRFSPAGPYELDRDFGLWRYCTLDIETGYCQTKATDDHIEVRTVAVDPDPTVKPTVFRTRQACYEYAGVVWNETSDVGGGLTVSGLVLVAAGGVAGKLGMTALAELALGPLGWVLTAAGTAYYLATRWSAPDCGSVTTGEQVRDELAARFAGVNALLDVTLRSSTIEVVDETVHTSVTPFAGGVRHPDPATAPTQGDVVFVVGTPAPSTTTTLAPVVGPEQHFEGTEVVTDDNDLFRTYSAGRSTSSVKVSARPGGGLNAVSLDYGFPLALPENSSYASMSLNVEAATTDAVVEAGPPLHLVADGVEVELFVARCLPEPDSCGFGPLPAGLQKVQSGRFEATVEGGELVGTLTTSGFTLSFRAPAA